MRMLSLRNVLFGAVVASGLLAANTASAAYDCNICYGWLWTTEYCTPPDEGQAGQKNCVDPNAGWSSCSTSGAFCMVIIEG